MTKQPDLVAAHELELFAINDGDLYRQTTQPNIRNIARKIVADTYDLAKARKAWQNVADAAAQSYTRQYDAPGQKGFGCFDKPTRDAAALSISFHYVDEMNETVDRYQLDKKNKAEWTLSAIRDANEKAGRFFFSRDTMKAFGDTMKSFTVDYVDGKIFVVRVKPMRDRDGRNMGGVGDRREFNPATGDIGGTVKAVRP